MDLLKLILAILFLAFAALQAQQKELFEHEKKIQKKQKKYNQLEPGWNLSLISNVTVTQTAYKKWEAGGSNVFVWATGMDGSAIYDTLQWNWASEMRLKYGNSKQNGQPSRKTDDVVDVESVVTYKENRYLNPYFSLNFLTQMAPGYKYKDDRKETISDILDPAYLTNGLGIGYAPKKTFRTRLGLAGRTVFTRNYNNYADGEQINFESGLQWVTHAERTFREKILLRSKLNLFSPFSDLNFSSIYWDTLIQASITKYIIVNLQTFVVYNKKASPYTQIKEVLSVGLSYRFI